MREPNKSDVALSVSKASFASWLSKLGGIASATLILRFIDPAQYGIWRFVMASVYFVLGWVGSPFSLVVTEAIQDAVAAEKGGTQRYQGCLALRGYLRFSVSIAFFLGGLVMVFAGPVASVMNLPTIWIVYLAGCLLMINGLRTVATAWIMVTARFGQQVRIQFFESVLYPVLIGAFLLSAVTGWIAVALSAVVAALGGLLISAPLIFEAYSALPKAGIRQEAMALYQIFRDHGKWAIANDMLKDVLDAGRIWLTRFLFGDAIVGLYGLADSLLGHVASLVSASHVYTSFLPRIMSDRVKLRGFIVDMVKFGTAASTMFLVASWLAMPFFSVAFPKYREAIPLYILMSIVLVYGGLTALLNAYYPIKRWQRPLFFMSAIRTGLSFLLLALFAPFGGVYALAGEMVLTGFFYARVRYGYLCRQQPEACISWQEVWLNSEDRTRFRHLLLRQIRRFSEKILG